MGAFNMPPGCSPRDIPGNSDEEICAVCCQRVDVCVCLECSVCGETGYLHCYAEEGHGMRLTKAQIAGREKARIAMLQASIDDAGQYLAWLEDQPDDYTLEISASPDPFA